MDSQDLRRLDSRQLIVLDEQRGELRFFFSKGDNKVFALTCRTVQLHVVFGTPGIDQVDDRLYVALVAFVNDFRQGSVVFVFPPPIMVGGYVIDPYEK